MLKAIRLESRKPIVANPREAAMAKIRIQRTHEFEGGEVKVADGVLYVDGKKVMDFPDSELRLETDGQVTISSDVPVTTTTKQAGGKSGSYSSAAASSTTSGKGGSVHVSTGDPELAEKIAKDVHDKVGDIGEKVAERVKESMERAFPPGFPFHDRK
ncbi:MAG TPA: hypothetical protein QF861_17265 [Alphaproteobacteria bacterium]|nr:hypothetical protein [Alphaproteobacteria bacterium]